MKYARNVLRGLGGPVVDSIVNGAQSMYSAAQAATQSAIDDLAQKVAQFQQAYNDFYSSQSDAYAVGMGDDFSSLQSIMDDVNSLIQNSGAIWTAVQNAQQSAAMGVSDWFYKVLHPNEVSITAPTPLQGLGLAPLVAAAAVAGLTAAIVYALSKYADYQGKLLSIKQQLIAEGKLSPSALDSPSIIGESASLLKWGLLGAGLLYFWPMLSPHLKRLAKR